MSVIKLSSPRSSEQKRGDFWEIPVLFEDDSLLALDKPAGLRVSPDCSDPQGPTFMGLLHAAIAAGKPWARERRINYLMYAHRLDAETSGVTLFARSKPVLAALANAFGSEKPMQKYAALVQNTPPEDQFEVNVKLAPHPFNAGVMCVTKGGKKSKTHFAVLEKFSGYTLLKCEPLTNRPDQVRVHLKHAGLPIVGDLLYSGKKLWLSRIKPGYRLKPGREERPLISRTALHLEEVNVPHPVTGEPLNICAPWPKDLKVAVKYLRQFGMGD